MTFQPPQIIETDFYGDAVLSAEIDGVIYIPVRRLCENLGVDWKSQHARLKSDPKFNCGDITIVGKDGKNREMLCLNERDCHAWLFSINANKVKRSLKEKLLRYQRECMDVLYKYWSGKLDTYQKPYKPTNDHRTAASYLHDLAKLPDLTKRERAAFIAEALELLTGNRYGHLVYVVSSQPPAKPPKPPKPVRTSMPVLRAEIRKFRMGYRKVAALAGITENRMRNLLYGGTKNIRQFERDAIVEILDFTGDPDDLFRLEAA